MLNIESFPSNISYKSSKTSNIPMQNSHCDYRNFDNVHLALEALPQKTHMALQIFDYEYDYCHKIHCFWFANAFFFFGYQVRNAHVIIW